MTKFFQLLLACCVMVAAATAPAQTVSEPKPEVLPDHTWRQVISLRGIATQEGMTTASLYVFFDPNCPFSAKLWQRRVDGKFFGELPAVWIPVTFVGKTALGKGAALLRANSKEELARNFKEFSFEHGEGATLPVAHTGAEWLALGRSKAVWYKLGGGTPTLVYLSKAGEAMVYRGGPSDPAKWAELVSNIALNHEPKRRLNDYQAK
jgi:thiol:disulfide interchange protein DsbG